MSVMKHPLDEVRKGGRFYPWLYLVTSGLCIPRHGGHLTVLQWCQHRSLELEMRSVWVPSWSEPRQSWDKRWGGQQALKRSIKDVCHMYINLPFK